MPTFVIEIAIAFGLIAALMAYLSAPKAKSKDPDDQWDEMMQRIQPVGPEPPPRSEWGVGSRP